MKAVNLVPVDARRGVGAPSRSNGVVYGVLGILGVFAVAAILLGLSVRTVNEREKELGQLASEASDADAQAARLAPYAKFVEIARERETTVTAVAALRFDWGAALREIARVVPEDVDLSTITGTRGGTANANADAAAAASGTPQFSLVGCASSQAEVAVFIARLRAIDGVERVRLDASAKADVSAGEGPSGGDDCRRNSGDAQFTSVVFFRGASGSAAASTAPDAGTPAAPPAPTAGQDGAS